MRNLFLFAVILFCSFQANAQVQYGIQAHGVMSTASFSEDEGETSKDSKFGFGAGVFAEFNLSPAFSIKPSLNFIQKGVEVSSSFSDDEFSLEQDIDARLNYLEVPVLFNYKPTANLYIGAGPSLAYGLSGKLKGTFSYEDETEELSETFDLDAFKDAEEDGGGFKRFDFGLTAAAGYYITENLSIQAGYTHGLSNIADDSEETTNEYKNRNFTLGLGYRF